MLAVVGTGPGTPHHPLGSPSGTRSLSEKPLFVLKRFQTTITFSLWLAPEYEGRSSARTRPLTTYSRTASSYSNESFKYFKSADARP